ncbi:MAG: hypothetical protein ACP5UI_02730 [Thermoprotei archaeon]
MSLEQTRPQFKPGFTWRSALGIIGSALIFIPVSMYASLLLGAGLGGPAVFATTVLMVELSKLFRQPLTRQETLILYYGAGVGGVTWGTTFVSLILYRTYFIHSPFAFAYKINGVPLAKLVPVWMAPPYNSPAYNVRSFFQPAFAPAIAYYAAMSAFGFIAEISIDMMIARAFVEVENYPFPYANVDVSFVTFMSERPKSYTKPFLMAMSIGAAFGLLVYLIPSLTGFYLIPLPYVDFTWALQSVLPGAVLTLPTPLGAYVAGFIFPFDAALVMLIAAVGIDVLQSLFVTTWPNVFPKWSSSYFRGMGFIAINTRSFATLWFAPQIGFMIGAAIMISFKARKGIVSVFKALGRLGRKSTSILGFPSMLTLLLLYLLGTLSSVALFNYLIPQIPVWLPLVMSVGFSFFVAVVISATQGTVGFAPPGIPGWSWMAAVYLTPYEGYPGFLSPPSIVGGAAGGFSQMTRSALITETKPIDLVKMSILTAILGTTVGLISINYFWSVAPIPSAVYPATIFAYPVSAQTDSLIVTRGLTFTPQIILGSAIIVMAIIAVGEALHKWTGMLWSTFGFLFGLYAGFPTAFSLFFGSAIGFYAMPRLVGGRESWNSYKAPVVAGEAFGEGLALFFATVLAMLTKSAWLWPW